MRQRVFPWLPAIAWAGFILYSGGSSFSAAHSESWLSRLFSLGPGEVAYLNIALRKLAHLFVYLLLSLLFLRALRGGDQGVTFRNAVLTLALCFMVAVTDEFRQSFEVSRSASPADLILDMLGAAVALRIAARFGGPPRQERDNAPRQKVLGLEP